MEESTKMIMYPELDMCKVIDTYLDPIYVFYKTFLVNVFGFFCCCFYLLHPFLCHNATSLELPGIAMLKNAVSAQVPKLCAKVPSSAAPNSPGMR